MEIDWRPFEQEGIELRLGENMVSYSTMRLCGVGDVVVVRSQKALRVVLCEFFKQEMNYCVIGLGSNLLFPEKGLLPYLLLDFPYDDQLFANMRDSYLLPASIPLNKLTAQAIRYGLSGWEVFSGIPGSLGGAVFMNAGTKYGEIGVLVKKVFLVTRQGREKVIEISSDIKKDCLPQAFFSYRKNHFIEKGDVISQVELGHFGPDSSVAPLIRDYLRKRGSEQPLTAATCGCVFQNYSKEFLAGKMIDELGLKGYRFKHFEVSTKHANFIEHKGGGTLTELMELISFIKNEVFRKYGVEISLEAKIVG